MQSQISFGTFPLNDVKDFGCAEALAVLQLLSVFYQYDQ